MAQIAIESRNEAPSGRPEPRRERRLAWWQIVIYLGLGIFTISSVGPLVFTAISSFKTMHDVLAFPPSLWPNPFIWSNYQEILSNSLFARWIFNALVYAVGAMVLNVVFSAMAGYALGRLNFPGREVIFAVTLAVMMIPSAITLIPKFLVVNTMHLNNTYFALILPAMAQPLDPGCGSAPVRRGKRKLTLAGSPAPSMVRLSASSFHVVVRSRNILRQIRSESMTLQGRGWYPARRNSTGRLLRCSDRNALTPREYAANATRSAGASVPYASSAMRRKRRRRASRSASSCRRCTRS